LPREVTVAFSEPLWEELTVTLAGPEESAGVLLAGTAKDGERLIYLVSRVIWVPDEHYVERGPYRLSIDSQGWVPALKLAADSLLHPIFFHTHPGGDPTPSESDDAVDAALAAPFLTRARVQRYASLILGGHKDAPRFTGRVIDEIGNSTAVARARIVGRRLTVLPAFNEPAFGANERVHDRQIRAFGVDGNRILASLRVGVVGAGGTGSAVLEQLVRLGVRDLVSVDDDDITCTNVSRVYGSSLSDEGRAKVDVAHANAERIGLGTLLTRSRGRTDKREALELLRTCDVVFGCTDDHTGRFTLSQLSFYYLVPLIDLGVVIDAPEGRIRSITGRITYVAPGEACLVCRGVVDLDLVREEAYATEERERLAGEGYARGLGEPDPAVVAYTTMVAAWGVSDLLERLFGFGADDVRGEIRLRIADRKMTSRSAQPEPAHICGDQSRWGLGDQPDFIGQRVWPE
jgi:proteasome lid subunit RPN8/RPN11